MTDYRILKKGEIIQEGDETDRCADPWRDDPVWGPAGNIGQPAPDPKYPSHRRYRRKIEVTELILHQMIDEIKDQLYKADYETIYKVAKLLDIKIDGYHERFGLFYRKDV